MAALPPGLKGLMVTAMLAALASTVDTHLNWGASYWTNDIYKRFVCQGWLRREPSARSLVWVARGANLLILAISLVVMTRLGSLASAWRTSLLLGAGLGGVQVLRWLWWRMNAWGEIAAIVASAILAPVLLGVLDGDGADVEAIRLILLFVGATTAGIAAALATRPEPSARLLDFYRRARPPGFWAPIARAAGRDPAADRRRLGLSLVAVATAAASLFAILVAVGSTIADTPPPRWFPRAPIPGCCWRERPSTSPPTRSRRSRLF
jgi:Na+/proline symporter